MLLNHVMSLLEMGNSVFKDIALCYTQQHLSATLIRTFGCYFKVRKSWTQGH